MKFLLGLLMILLSAEVVRADAVIFSGQDVKTLKYNVDLFGRSKVLGTNADPTAGAGLAAPLGSLAMDYLTGGAWIKTGAGDTQWSNIQVGPIDLTSDVTGVLPIANGGTNKALTLDAGGIVWSDADSFEVASAGTAGQVLHSGGTGAPTWSAVDLTADVSGILPIASGGSNKALTLAAGGVLWSDADSFEVTSAGTSGYPLLSNGTSAPAFGQLDVTSAITGLVPVSSGGTGISSGTSGGVLAFTAAGTIASSTALDANQVVIGGGAGAAPSTLAAGSQYQSLVMGASNPAWSAVPLNQAAAVSGVLAVANGGTGLSTIAAQRIPFASALDTYSTDANFIYNSSVPSRLYLGSPGTTSGKFNITNTSAIVGGLQNNNTVGLFGMRTYTQTTMINSEFGNASNTAAEGTLIHINRSRGTNAARTQTMSGDMIGNIMFNGYTSGSAFGTVGSSAITGYAAEDQTATAQGGELRFSTVPLTTIVPKERLILKSTGELQFIGSTSGYVGISPPAGAITSYSMTWPNAQGADTTFLVNNGAGGLSWSSAMTISSDLTLDPADTINILTSASRTQIYRVQGNAGTVTMSTTPFGATDPLDGTVVELIGNSDTNTVSITWTDSANGCVGNFGTITLHKYEVAVFRYNSSMDRWIYVP